MKILQINNLHHRRGGADVVYLNTGELLEKYGHEVVYFSQKHDNNYSTEYEKYFVNEIDYFNTTILKKLLLIPRFFYSIEAKRKLKKLILFEKPDIAHIHLYKGSLTPSILKTLKKYKIPTIATLHDYGLLCPHNLLLDGQGKICEKCINGSSLNCIINKCNRNRTSLSIISAAEYKFNNIFFNYNKYFDRLIPVSKFSYEKHIKGFANTKTKFIHLYNFAHNLSEVKMNSDGKYLLYYGRLSKEKGIKTLIDAYSQSNLTTTLKIVGTGALFNELTSFIKEKSCSNIQMLGFKEGEELNNLIKNASYVIVPSEWYENNPLTIIEAYSFGKPVIASNIGGISEIVQNAVTGFLFEAGNIDALKKILIKSQSLSTSEYIQMSCNARNFAEKNFNPEIHYQELLNIYKDLLNRKTI